MERKGKRQRMPIFQWLFQLRSVHQRTLDDCWRVISIAGCPSCFPTNNVKAWNGKNVQNPVEIIVRMFIFSTQQVSNWVMGELKRPEYAIGGHCTPATEQEITRSIGWDNKATLTIGWDNKWSDCILHYLAPLRSSLTAKLTRSHYNACDNSHW